MDERRQRKISYFLLAIKIAETIIRPSIISEKDTHEKRLTNIAPKK